MSSTNKHSKEVFVRRLPISIPENEAVNGDKPEIKDYFDLAYRAIGSYWPKGSNRPGTGLTLSEENLLMPYLLNIDVHDRDFREKSTQYFHDISLKVEPDTIKGEGQTKLEIGIPDPEAPLSLTNLPFSVSDYVHYRHLVGDGIKPGHPEVALSLEQGKGDSRKMYYIHNPVDVQKTTVSNADLKAEAYGIYLEIRKDVLTVNQYLTILKVDPATVIGQEAAALQKHVETNPDMIVKINKNPNRVPTALLLDLLNANIFEEIGNRVLLKENGFQIGKDRKEAVAYLRDTTNHSREILGFKSKLQDYRKKKKIATENLDKIDLNKPSDTPAE